MKAKIEFKNIYKIFGDNTEKALALLKEGKDKLNILEEENLNVGINNVSLKIQEGEFFVLMGLSGSGKSTLIRHLNRLIDCSAGEVLINDININSLSKEELRDFRRKKISMVFQRFGLLPHYNVYDNVVFGLKIRGEKKEIYHEKVQEWIEQVGLAGYENSYPNQLSGGMRQRVGIARALATDPEIILMDEPFSALDPLIRAEMQETLLNLKSKLKKTIIFVTHDLEEAVKLADRMAIMKDGEVIQSGTPDEIIKNPNSPYIKKFVDQLN